MNALFGGAVTWFPEDLAHEFYVLKGALALTATLMVLAHMSHTWHDVTTWGRRLRYFALLYITVLVTVGSGEQASQDVLVSYRNLGGFLGMLLVVGAMVVSIREDVAKFRGETTPR